MRTIAIYAWNLAVAGACLMTVAVQIAFWLAVIVPFRLVRAVR